MSGCLACLEDVTGDARYHERCSRRLFGAPHPPAVDVELAKLHALGLAMAGHVSISGTQRKVSLDLSADRMTLQLAAFGGRYIVKPQAQTYPSLPENEHLTMQLAGLAGLKTPPNALVEIKDGTLAYVVVRFDRPPAGGKLRQEDFCQLSEHSPKQKYESSAESCARIIRKFATEPGVEMLALYRLVAFSWWVANGDMHLKNFSILADAEGRQGLSPTYDQLCTRLVIPSDTLALPVCGKRDGLDGHTWAEFGRYCLLPDRAVARVLGEIAGSLEPALRLVRRSMLPPAMRADYSALLTERSELLTSALNARE